MVINSEDLDMRNNPDKPPIFISFVKDELLDNDIHDIKEMKEANGTVIAFDKNHKILGIGFNQYNHVLTGTDIQRGQDEGKTLDEVLDELSIDPADKIQDLINYMPLKEVKKALIEDETLSNHERFELYYKQHKMNKEMKK